MALQFPWSRILDCQGGLVGGIGLGVKHQEARLVRLAGAQLCKAYKPCQGIWAYSRGNWALGKVLKAGQGWFRPVY